MKPTRWLRLIQLRPIQLRPIRLLPLLLLTACQSSPDPQAIASKAIPPLRPAKIDPAATASTATTAGLTPLPSPQQVITAQPVGRPDPFLPVQGVATGGAGGQPGLPPGFRFNGVIRTGGQAQALVQFGSESGSLRPGDVGGRSTNLLPPGWAVGGIDVARGRLILRASGQAIAVSLDGRG
ncbi:MAG: hypothetical protein FJ060_03120 [Cyanobacteria bacterium K_Offshore_0m_m2_072]|nr:hypothetical protein [Cyanobacteria bacterium K_Offshore_0m_m2_072]